ncbi:MULTISPECIES: c-type cytochrome [unclassified Methylobacterium]|jgi:cytochrome c|uniref:c-type cytochrome n=1 Tax=unclassified Methylobacterium TaxID=2615210 RepID=UPI0008F3AB4D|nr:MULTISPECIES: c-type cytochrome [unclassified Methylobacterium]MDE4909596.1 c-type cytochrome [Methylobacterium sp. 092160098-2]SFV11188.1 cytochrome c [Methylobacterium sp. UNCCL125]
MPRLQYGLVLATLFWIACGLTEFGSARAQVGQPVAQLPSGQVLFERQCATCHSINTTDPPRQGPTLFGVIGRKAGTVAGYHYSAGFSKADWTWDEARLDRWLTNPQAMIPGAIMPYRQSKAEVRSAIIGYLKELH